jgi:hypothetical protein
VAAHERLDYKTELEREIADEVFEAYWENDNPSVNSVHYDYLIHEDDGNIYVDEIGELDGNVSVRRSLIVDFEDQTTIEGLLTDNLAEIQKERYEEMSYSNSSL